MTVRQADSRDVETISQIIGDYAAQGLMLPRSRQALLQALEYYMVVDIDGRLAGGGGLQLYGCGMAGIYGLAVSPSGSRRGTGSALVEALVGRARSLELTRVFALTATPRFFEKLGFHTVPHAALPVKLWKDCVACPKFGNCDEIAVLRDLG